MTELCVCLIRCRLRWFMRPLVLLLYWCLRMNRGCGRFPRCHCRLPALCLMLFVGLLAVIRLLLRSGLGRLFLLMVLRRGLVRFRGDWGLLLLLVAWSDLTPVLTCWNRCEIEMSVLLCGWLRRKNLRTFEMIRVIVMVSSLCTGAMSRIRN